MDFLHKPSMQEWNFYFKNIKHTGTAVELKIRYWHLLLQELHLYTGNL